MKSCSGLASGVGVVMSKRIGKIRIEIASRILQEEARHFSKTAALSELFDESQDDPLSFHQAWLMPLLDEGLSLESACAYVLEFHSRPN